MGYNTELRKKDLSEITLQVIKEGIFLCYRDGIKSKAPLGFSGDNIVLFGSEKDGRVSLVSLRNYCSDPELLITDEKGHFLFYGRFDVNLGVNFIAEQYLQILNLVKKSIECELLDISNFKNMPEAQECSYSEGFEMIKLYQAEKARQKYEADHQI